MGPAALLSDGFDRVAETIEGLLDGLSSAQLAARPAHDANTIAWLVWHLTRVQDGHVAEVAGTEELWTASADAGSWADRFDLPFDRDATGFAMSSEDVGRVRVGADLLGGYHRAVHEATSAFLAGLEPDDLDRVVDDSWDPPVTLGSRLVSVLDDDTQHVGQAAYVKGIVAS